MILTRAEAAQRLRVHPHTVWRYIKAGRLRASKTGPRGHLRITEEAIAEFLAANETGGAGR